jgi:hypothetical protein
MFTEENGNVVLKLEFLSIFLKKIPAFNPFSALDPRPLNGIRIQILIRQNNAVPNSQLWLQLATVLPEKAAEVSKSADPPP